ncbi:GDSL-type esterase/lipase family protein [Bifidobacterium biavatii]|uniref:RnfABCDGE type electron transport complex subunit D n=1 Tax=Bifidobacterium biavatii DSM 23969 TaxID=1437608 RepID=A0A086ZNI0_9BIFI|nr:GDSL-type esterase/lipase family protein [Bifidobacterium biavatii]KFI48080.1 RnfABCDGE type electron transport complex subunit D [Bifidobacterium biavatii DSM 23969]
MIDSNDARVIIAPNDPALRTMGRIDDADPPRPIWVYPYTQVAFRFTGTSLTADLINYWNYGDSHLEVIIDGVTAKVRIPSGFVGLNDMPNSSTASHDPTDDMQPETSVALPAPASPRTPFGTGWTNALPNSSSDATVTPVTVTLADNLPNIEHTAIVCKRQDGQHYVQLFGFGLDAGARVLPPLDPAPVRRMEIFGDSVSCGERNEAALYVGKLDPDVDLSSYSNAWMSYGAIAARRLGAALHDVSQGGASLIDGIGWFRGPDYIGQESIWDRVEYNPTLGETKPWDFARYTPQVVVIAIGQNDAHPDDFMARDYHGEQAAHWRSRYVDFLRSLHERYPHATIICTTTVLRHDPAWDRAIDEAVYTFNADLAAEAQDLAALCQLGMGAAAEHAASAGNRPAGPSASVGHAPVAYHFLYSRNGVATPGHPRVAEHEEMARELAAFIESLGPSVWND